MTREGVISTCLLRIRLTYLSTHGSERVLLLICHHDVFPGHWIESHANKTVKSDRRSRAKRVEKSQRPSNSADNLDSASRSPHSEDL